METYIVGIVQGFVIIAVLWVKISDLSKRVDRIEGRVDSALNGSKKGD